MISSEGRVVALDGSDWVWVEVAARASMCPNCTSTQSCPSGLADNDGGRRRFRVANRIQAVVGDRVTLNVADGTVLRVAWWSYLLPVGLAIAGAAVGQGLAGDGGAIAGTLIGLGGGFTYLRGVERRAAARDSMVFIDRPQPAACQFMDTV